MRIDRISVDVVAIPIDPPRVSSLGTVSEDVFGIVQVHADGVVGIGEVATLWNGGAAAESRFLIDVLAPRLLGQDATGLARNLRQLATFRDEHLPAQAALDMALHDLAAKIAGVPVHDLLGGRSRDEIILSHSIPTADPHRMADLAAAAVERGFGCVKVKIGKDSATDRERVRIVRQAIGDDTRLRVDANMAWPSVKAAAREIRRLSEFDLHSVEQPLPPGDAEQLAKLRWMVDVPIMADESVWSAREAMRHISADAVDMINVYVAEAGGLRPAESIFRISELAHVSCVIGAMPELGIGTAAAVHLGLAVPELGDYSDASGQMYHRHDVVHESFDFSDGRVTALPGPGLGVTIDPARVEAYRVGHTLIRDE